MEKVVVRQITYGIHEVHKEGLPPTIDPEAFQRLIQLIDEYITRVTRDTFRLPSHLLYQSPPFEVQPLTLEQVRPLFRVTFVPQPVRDYCGECYYSNKGARFCGLGLTMQVGCTQREMEYE